MSYDHAGAVVFVGALVAERHPAYYDLCRTHLDGLTAPRGWTVRREPLHVAGAVDDAATTWHKPRLAPAPAETGS